MPHRIRQALPIPDLTPTEVARFYSKLHVGGCGLTWAGGDTNSHGYGRFAIYRHGKRVRILAHRLAFKLFTGHDPGEAIILHGCDTPPCCTPDCLCPGTHADNARDAVERGRLQHPQKRTTAALKLIAGQKRCNRCHQVKNLEMFARRSRVLDGRQSECRDCFAERKRIRSQEDAA